MKLSKDIRTITYLKSRAADLIWQVNETRRPVIITQNGKPRAVLQDLQSYENMRKTITILKLLSLGEDNVREGRYKTQQELFAHIEGIQKY